MPYSRKVPGRKGRASSIWILSSTRVTKKVVVNLGQTEKSTVFDSEPLPEPDVEQFLERRRVGCIHVDIVVPLSEQRLFPVKSHLPTSYTVRRMSD